MRHLTAARQPRLLLVVVAVVLTGLSLRAPITVVGPLIDDIRSGTGISTTATGVVTTLPILAFGLASGLAAAAGRRFGLEAVLAASAVVIACGLVIRSTPGLALLYSGAAILGVGIAFANVLLPALIKRDFPARLGAMTALYSATLGASAAVGAGLAVPLADGTALGWRGTLAVWLIPTLLAVGALAVIARRGSRPDPAAVSALPGRAFLRSGLAWSVAGFFGLQSMAYFVSVAWLPAILLDSGIGRTEAGNLAFLFQVVGIVALLGLPGLAERAVDQRGLVVAMCAVAVAGAVGLLMAGTTATTLWVVLLGLGQSAGLALALMFVVLRTRHSDDASTLSGMSQAFGYAIAAAGPLVAGLIHDATASWDLVLLTLVGIYAILLAVGLSAGRSIVIGVSTDDATHTVTRA